MAQRSRRRGQQPGFYVPVEAAKKPKALSEQMDIRQSRLLRQALLLFKECADVLSPEGRKASK